LLHHLPNDEDLTRITIDFHTVLNAPGPNATLGEFEVILCMSGVTQDKA
jgi:hypothetical protein